MKHTRYSTIAAALLSVIMLQAAPVAAQRVFVTAQGSDGNPCTFALPCRSFQRAHDVVAAGGEIDVLDPAGYGMLVIRKAISIQGHGFAGVSVAAGSNGIRVSASATDAVNLNGLLIEGGGVGNMGIQFNSGKSLLVANCVIRNLAGDGLRLNASAASLQTLAVSDSYFTDNAINGIFIVTLGSGAVTVALERVALSGNETGLNVSGASGTGPLSVTVTDSVAAHNSSGGVGIGFFVTSSGGTTSVASLMLTRVTAVGNVIGVKATGANATLRLARSAVTGNENGYQSIGGGVLLSYGDNIIDDNGGNFGTLGSATKQ